MRTPSAARRKCADTYCTTSARLGQQPAEDVWRNLLEQGALIVDLQLCRQEAEPVLLLLREAPRGVQHLVLYDGAQFFGQDPHYQVKLRAVQQRCPNSILGEPLWLLSLVESLGVFCAARGQGVLELELTGLPLGKQVQNLLTPLARCLQHLPALQKLHLAGCSLQDKGLAALAPHLASKLPKLSHLSLARNQLQDLRPLARVLQGRAQAQRRRCAAPMHILDLSQNPLLGVSLEAAGRRGGSLPSRPGRRRSLERTREALLDTICEALRDGFVLGTLRLRAMRLTEDDMRPLLRLLCMLAKQWQAGFAFPFQLETISLEGNPLDHQLQAAVAQGLRCLAAQVRRGEAGGAGQRTSQSTQSLPLYEAAAATTLDDQLKAAWPDVVPLRYAVSEGDAASEVGDATLRGGGAGEATRASRASTKKHLQEEYHLLQDCLADRRKQQQQQQRRQQQQQQQQHHHQAAEETVEEAPEQRRHDVQRPQRPTQFADDDTELSDPTSEELHATLRQLARDTPSESGEDEERGPGAAEACRRHAKLDLLRGLFQQGGDIPAGPEVLRYALDVISSETSLNTAENDEALIMIWDHIADLRRLQHQRQAAASAVAGGELGPAVRRAVHSAHSI